MVLQSHTTIRAQSIPVLRGTVTDASTAEPLIAANIRVLGTSKGTITNAQGKFTLSLEPGTYSIVVSYVAYQPETLLVILTTDMTRDVVLQPSPIQIPEVVVLAEDPAIEIIRKAIAHKRTWMDRLTSYRFDAFTRQVLRRDTAIASITEAYTTGFMRTGDTLKEIVKQKRQTENISASENLASVRRIVNFNDDTIDLFTVKINGNSAGYSFVGPTAPDALDNYDYKLLNTSRTSGVEIYQIRMTPKSRLKALFEGTITIADETFAVIGVNVKPNESFNIPFVKDIDLRYRQQFGLYDSSFWMPTDIRLTGKFTVSFIGLSLPRIGIEATSSIYDYAINAPIPDSIFQQPRLVVDSSTTTYDSTFWKQNEVLPLTLEEQKAYKTLDSTQTLEKQFQPKGPLAALGNDGTESVLNFMDVRFNRVEGFFFGGRTTLNKLSPFVRVDASAGYGFSDNRFKYDLGATLFTSKEHLLGVGAEMYDRLDHVPDAEFYGSFPISFMALIDRNDYRDYYLSKGWKTFLSTNPTANVNATLSFTGEQQYSLDNQTDYSLFSKTSVYRPNPTIVDGTMRSLQFDLRLGAPPEPIDIVSRNAVEFFVEHSSPSLLKSEFDFTRYHGRVLLSFETFAKSLLFSPMLRISISGGIGAGTLPPQRAFVIDSRSSGYAPFGVLKGAGIKELAGDRFVMINLEHNFRSIPFLALNLPFLYRNGIELVVHGSFAQTWIGSLSTSDGWYSEAGIGISRVLDLLRADITYRFKEPKRFYFSVSFANLF
ncbi:MAG: carboxypeptidase-like regulatory domain-containing protein [Ignavibacteriales bacterium]|nr:carboxypeptidase-like regulatory domain-containing protein [Ignavibacteriales bacterium]